MVIGLRRTIEGAPVARIRGKNKGDVIDFEEQDHTSWHYIMQLGEHFIIGNLEGHFIQGLVLSAKHESIHGVHEIRDMLCIQCR